ncbi:MAG: hypothetical protein AAF787_05175 [Chloroflexota bacterium]
MTFGASIFFVIFAMVQVLSYLAIRREWFAPGVVAGAGIVGSIVAAMLMSIAQGNSIVQALMVGLIMGGLLNAVTLGAAWFFHMNEMRSAPES